MMDLDLAFSLTCLASIAALSFVLAVCLSKHASMQRQQGIALAIVIAGTAYGFGGWDQVWLSHLIPASSLIVFGNWFPLFAAALAGVVSQGHALPVWRRSIAAIGMLSIGAYAMAFPLIGSAPQCDDRWQGSICLQSTPFTCSAASAATLLRAHGIDASELEMARLCLTSRQRNGTSWQGVFRGLSLKTAGTPWKVEVFHGRRTDLSKLIDRPALLVACLPTDGPVDPIYREACGWIPGQPHAVVFFELRNRMAVIGDPQFGHELWTQSDLHVLWTGLGFRLVPRE